MLFQKFPKMSQLMLATRRNEFKQFKFWPQTWIAEWNVLSNSAFETRHEISNNVVCATSKASDQPAHTRSLIRVFSSRLNIL